jgi:hypothetical protein
MMNASQSGGPPAAQAPVPQIDDRELKRLYDYWVERRGNRLMPARADIDPLAIGYILGHLFLFDVLPGPKFRIRLQGSELTWWIGQELTGDLLDGLPQPQLRALAQTSLADVVAVRRPTHWIGNHDLDGVRRHYETLLLPLSSDGSSVDVVIAGIRCRIGGAA